MVELTHNKFLEDLEIVENSNKIIKDMFGPDYHVFNCVNELSPSLKKYYEIEIGKLNSRLKIVSNKNNSVWLCAHHQAVFANSLLPVIINGHR